MPRRHALTDTTVRRIKPGPKRQVIPDGGMIGHYIRVTPSGARSYAAVARDPYGRQVWATIGSADHLSVEESRARAREIIRRIKDGKPPVEPAPVAPDSFRDVAENWFRRHAEAKGLRTRDEMRRALEKYIYPHWATRPFADIKRSDVARLLDHVEDQHGSRMADQVLAYLSSVMHWQAARSDDYTPPVVRGMRRTSSRDKTRDRTLNDDEIRLVWKRAEEDGQFGALIRLLLLTGQRLSKVATMHWDDISIDGTWTIRSEAREKGNAGVLVLPKIAAEIIRAQSRIAGNPYVLAGRDARTHIANWTKRKRQFDAGLPPGLPGWVLHDLRRTARSLLSRAGVRPDISERVLGHVQPGVQGIYDRHAYTEEKRIALEKLAALISDITNPPTGKVVRLKRR